MFVCFSNLFEETLIESENIIPETVIHVTFPDMMHVFLSSNSFNSHLIKLILNSLAIQLLFLSLSMMRFSVLEAR